MGDTKKKEEKQSRKGGGMLESESKQVVKELLSEKIFMQGLGTGERVSHVDKWGKNMKSRRNSKYRALRGAPCPQSVWGPSVSWCGGREWVSRSMEERRSREGSWKLGTTFWHCHEDIVFGHCWALSRGVIPDIFLFPITWFFKNKFIYFLATLCGMWGSLSSHRTLDNGTNIYLLSIFMGYSF